MRMRHQHHITAIQNPRQRTIHNPLGPLSDLLQGFAPTVANMDHGAIAQRLIPFPAHLLGKGNDTVTPQFPFAPDGVGDRPPRPALRSAVVPFGDVRNDLDVIEPCQPRGLTCPEQRTDKDHRGF